MPGPAQSSWRRAPGGNQPFHVANDTGVPAEAVPKSKKLAAVTPVPMK